MTESNTIDVHHDWLYKLPRVGHPEQHKQKHQQEALPETQDSESPNLYRSPSISVSTTTQTDNQSQSKMNSYDPGRHTRIQLPGDSKSKRRWYNRKTLSFTSPDIEPKERHPISSPDKKPERRRRKRRPPISSQDKKQEGRRRKRRPSPDKKPERRRRKRRPPSSSPDRPDSPDLNDYPVTPITPVKVSTEIQERTRKVKPLNFTSPDIEPKERHPISSPDKKPTRRRRKRRPPISSPDSPDLNGYSFTPITRVKISTEIQERTREVKPLNFNSPDTEPKERHPISSPDKKPTRRRRKRRPPISSPDSPDLNDYSFTPTTHVKVSTELPEHPWIYGTNIDSNNPLQDDFSSDTSEEVEEKKNNCIVTFESMADALGESPTCMNMESPSLHEPEDLHTLVMIEGERLYALFDVRLCHSVYTILVDSYHKHGNITYTNGRMDHTESRLKYITENSERYLRAQIESEYVPANQLGLEPGYMPLIPSRKELLDTATRNSQMASMLYRYLRRHSHFSNACSHKNSKFSYSKSDVFTIISS